MEFYRLYHGLPYDARLAVIAKRSGLNRAESLAIFIALHDHASQMLPRGSLLGFDAEQAALALDLDATKVKAAIDALMEKGIIEADQLTEWTRQLSPSTERVRRHRAKRRAAGLLLQKRPTPTPSPDDPAEAARRRQRLQEAALPPRSLVTPVQKKP